MNKRQAKKEKADQLLTAEFSEMRMNWIVIIKTPYLLYNNNGQSKIKTDIQQYENFPN